MKIDKKVLLRQLEISWIPFLLAIAYASIAYFSADVTKRSIMTAVNYFSATFFFLMWIVGQYLRTSKELNDTSNYSSLQTGISDLQRAISKLQTLTPQTETTSPVSSDNTLLKNAKSAVDNGFVLAGLMQAGVAFEQAILSRANRLQIPRDNRTTVAQLFNRFRDFYPDGTIREFFAIWKLRNQLIHLTEEAAQELEKSPKLINYFEWAINELERDRHE